MDSQYTMRKDLQKRLNNINQQIDLFEKFVTKVRSIPLSDQAEENGLLYILANTRLTMLNKMKKRWENRINGK